MPDNKLTEARELVKELLPWAHIYRDDGEQAQAVLLRVRGRAETCLARWRQEEARDEAEACWVDSNYQIWRHKTTGERRAVVLLRDKWAGALYVGWTYQPPRPEELRWSELPLLPYEHTPAARKDAEWVHHNRLDWIVEESPPAEDADA